MSNLIVIYEIYNEPMEDTWESVKEYATDIITEIRKYDPDNIILVGSPHWDQDLHLVAADPLQGFNNNNVYAPFLCGYP